MSILIKVINTKLKFTLEDMFYIQRNRVFNLLTRSGQDPVCAGYMSAVFFSEICVQVQTKPIF